MSDYDPEIALQHAVLSAIEEISEVLNAETAMQFDAPAFTVGGAGAHVGEAIRHSSSIMERQLLAGIRTSISRAEALLRQAQMSLQAIEANHDW